MTIRPVQRGDIDRSVGEIFERGRRLERLTSGIWVYVGSGDPLPDGPDLDGNAIAPPFLNSWDNSGGGLQELRFRWLQGSGVEIQGSIAGGTLGSVVFVLPNSPLFRPDSGEIRLTATNDAGGLVVWRVLPTGLVYAGV